LKLIIAYIKPERLNDVKQALYRAEVRNMSVTNALGCGRAGGFHESYRGVDVEVILMKKVRLEIAVNDEFVDRTVGAIVEGARTNKKGDGMIFLLDLPECIRIRTGETGGTAVG